MGEGTEGRQSDMLERDGRWTDKKETGYQSGTCHQVADLLMRKGSQAPTGRGHDLSPGSARSPAAQGGGFF